MQCRGRLQTTMSIACRQLQYSATSFSASTTGPRSRPCCPRTVRTTAGAPGSRTALYLYEYGVYDGRRAAQCSARKHAGPLPGRRRESGRLLAIVAESGGRTTGAGTQRSLPGPASRIRGIGSSAPSTPGRRTSSAIFWLRARGRLRGTGIPALAIRAQLPALPAVRHAVNKVTQRVSEDPRHRRSRKMDTDCTSGWHIPADHLHHVDQRT